MDADGFQKLVAILHRTHADSAELATFLVIPLLAGSILAGGLVARWIFRGGLSRCTVANLGRKLF